MSQCRVEIDKDLCQGHGVCESEAPRIFKVTEGDSAYPQAQILIEPIPENQKALAKKAARYCPNGAITVVELDE